MSRSEPRPAAVPGDRDACLHRYTVWLAQGWLVGALTWAYRAARGVVSKDDARIDPRCDPRLDARRACGIEAADRDRQPVTAARLELRPQAVSTSRSRPPSASPPVPGAVPGHFPGDSQPSRGPRPLPMNMSAAIGQQHTQVDRGDCPCPRCPTALHTAPSVAPGRRRAQWRQARAGELRDTSPQQHHVHHSSQGWLDRNARNQHRLRGGPDPAEPVERRAGLRRRRRPPQ